MVQKLEQHIIASEAGINAIELLAEHTPPSWQQLKIAMTNGAVWLETRHGINRIRRAKKALQLGDSLHLYYDSNIQSQQHWSPTRVITASGTSPAACIPRAASGATTAACIDGLKRTSNPIVPPTW